VGVRLNFTPQEQMPADRHSRGDCEKG
jgi:hypothetical protein